VTLYRKWTGALTFENFLAPSPFYGAQRGGPGKGELGVGGVYSANSSSEGLSCRAGGQGGGQVDNGQGSEDSNPETHEHDKTFCSANPGGSRRGLSLLNTPPPVQGQSLTYQSPRDLVPSSSEEEEDTSPGAAAEAKANAGISAVEPAESGPGLGARGQRKRTPPPPPPRRTSAVEPVEMVQGRGGARGEERAVVAGGGVGAEKEEEVVVVVQEEGGEGIIIEAVAAAVEAGPGGGAGQEGRDVVEEGGRGVVSQAVAAARFAATMAETMAQKEGFALEDDTTRRRRTEVPHSQKYSLW
jgi:hypothetical protein